MLKTYPHYQVAADRDTGEWLYEPKPAGEVNRTEWDARQDTKAAHYDTYEAPIFDDTGATMTETETRAVTVVWDD